MQAVDFADLCGGLGLNRKMPGEPLQQSISPLKLARYFMGYFWNFGAVWETEPLPCGHRPIQE
jgi:hypothetical protein